MYIDAGVSEQQLPQMVEEQIEKNRRVRERELRKRQGLIPIRKRRKASDVTDQDPRSSRSRTERRRYEQASRVDDGELGPGFVPRRPPRSVFEPYAGAVNLHVRAEIVGCQCLDNCKISSC